MSDLHERLDAAFAAVEPGAAPVDAAMRTGRKIRTRRRAGVLVGALAVVAAVVGGVPAIAHHRATPAPATGRIRVTVNPPGPHSPAGLIASGLIGDEPWGISIQSVNTQNCMITGPGFSASGCSLGQASAAAPINFEGESSDGGSNAGNFSFGQVWSGVVAARVQLSDGAVLTLHPATVGGLRFVAFGTPASVLVESVTAYARSGEIAVAIPYQAPHGVPDFVAWLAPGQPGSPRLTKTFGSGTIAIAYQGPWGTCLEMTDIASCLPVASGLGTAAMGFSPSVVYGSAAPSVLYLMITGKNGRTIRAVATAVGRQKFWAIALSAAQQVGARWTAYNTAGRPAGSGSIHRG